MQLPPQDLRFAIRNLRKNPGFAVAAALTLALGIGANTAIFSLINAVLLRPLPVSDPNQLVAIRAVSAHDTETEFPLSVFERIRDDGRSLAGAFAFDTTRLSAKIDGQSEVLSGDCVSGTFFTLLGVTPTRGRPFTIEDDRPDAQPVAVISYSYWKRRFALDPGTLGQRITLKGAPFVIVGVAPEGFLGVEPGLAPDLWVPMAHWPALRLNDHLSVGIIARLGPSVTPETARAEIETIYRRSWDGPRGLAGSPNVELTGPPHIELLPAGHGLSDLRDEFEQPL
ncbi:MAG: ABC transporter permease, partial [Thermoanaerobaculia bacterium]